MKVYDCFFDVFLTERIQEKVDFIFDFKMVLLSEVKRKP